jgi:hypothetical protein
VPGSMGLSHRRPSLLCLFPEPRGRIIRGSGNAIIPRRVELPLHPFRVSRHPFPWVYKPVRRAGRCTPFPEGSCAPVAGTTSGVPCVPYPARIHSPMFPCPRRPFAGYGNAAEEPPTPETPAAATPRLAVWSLLFHFPSIAPNPLILLGLLGCPGSPMIPWAQRIPHGPEQRRECTSGWPYVLKPVL